MATQKQIEANRRNALHSTGPHEEGKPRTRLNALKHGGYAKILIPDESDKDLVRLKRIYLAHYRPRTALEQQHVLKLAVLEWRFQRFARMEAEILTAHGYECDSEQNSEYYYAGAGWGFTNDCKKTKSVSVLSQVEARLAREFRALKKDLDKRLPAAVQAVAQSTPQNAVGKPDEKPAGEGNDTLPI